MPPGEFTLRAVAAGVVLGLVFGAANAYLGLRVGLTVSASIPAAVMAVAFFRVLGRRGTILEANISQTIGSASTALASGTIFTIPALFLWGMTPPYLQVVALCFLGGVLGLAAMIPLRRILIVEAHDELPYPEGTACAEVLKATSRASAAGTWIFRGIAVAATVKLATGLLFLFPSELSARLPVLPNAVLALELAPALLAVGYILGYRQSGVLVAGSLVSALVLIPLITWVGGGRSAPLFPETARLVSKMGASDIWSRYVRYIGAGAVAVAGLLTVVKNLPTMGGAFAGAMRGLSRKRRSEAASGAATDRDLSGQFVVGAILFVIAVAAFVPGVFAGGMGPLPRAVCAAGVALFGLLFVTVAARIVGIVGVSSQPTSGITLVTLLGVASVFAAAGWTEPAARAAVLTVGTIVAIAASKAGDISQDLKTGYLVGATPARQQLGQLIGAAFACWGRGGNGPPARGRVPVRHEGDPRAPGGADEDDHRGSSLRRAAVGARSDRGRPRDLRDALRRLRPRVRDRRLSPARFDGSDLRRGMHSRLGAAPPGRRARTRRSGHPRRVGAGGRRGTGRRARRRARRGRSGAPCHGPEALRRHR